MFIVDFDYTITGRDTTFTRKKSLVGAQPSLERRIGRWGRGKPLVLWMVGNSNVVCR